MRKTDVGGPCADHASPRAYIAAPLFTPEQRAAIDCVDNILRDCGYITYSPYRDGVMLAPTDPPAKRDEVFYSNKLAIRQSDLLVAILDTKDTGTIWELGMSAALDIPTVAVTLAVQTMNVMLERGVLAHVTSLAHLAEVLHSFRPYLTYGRKVTNQLREDEAAQRYSFRCTYTYSGETQ